MPQNITYHTNKIPACDVIIDLYRRAALARPIDDFARIKKMYENADLVISAWAGEKLIGIARSVTDFSYCCYLSDLAVLPDFQKQGIGWKLIELTKEAVSPQSMVLLLASPEAISYYQQTKMEHLPDNAFIIKRAH